MCLQCRALRSACLTIRASSKATGAGALACLFDLFRREQENVETRNRRRPDRQARALAAHVVEEALASGLTWDQAITAFGIASKAIAAQAASQGNGTLEQCTLHAQERLRFGMEQSSDVLKAWLS